MCRRYRVITVDEKPPEIEQCNLSRSENKKKTALIRNNYIRFVFSIFSIFSIFEKLRFSFFFCCEFRRFAWIRNCVSTDMLKHIRTLTSQYTYYKNNDFFYNIIHGRCFPYNEYANKLFGVFDRYFYFQTFNVRYIDADQFSRRYLSDEYIRTRVNYTAGRLFLFKN